MVSGIVNLLISASKLNLFLGNIKKLKYENAYAYANVLMALACLQYVIFISRFLYAYEGVYTIYPMEINITVAFVAFLELFFAIRNLYLDKMNGGFFRCFKLMNFYASLVVMNLTMDCLLNSNLESEHDYKYLVAYAGLTLGLIFFLVFTFNNFIEDLSPIDNNILFIKSKKDVPEREVILKSNTFYSYVAYYERLNEDTVKCEIKRENLRRKINIFIRIILIILSEILIFVYFIMAIIYYIRSLTVVSKIKKEM